MTSHRPITMVTESYSSSLSSSFHLILALCLPQGLCTGFCLLSSLCLSTLPPASVLHCYLSAGLSPNITFVQKPFLSKLCKVTASPPLPLKSLVSFCFHILPRMSHALHSFLLVSLGTDPRTPAGPASMGAHVSYRWWGGVRTEPACLLVCTLNPP